jgi:hypothetical protein
VLTETGTLDRIADALDLLPLSVQSRAAIFEAIDTAPNPQTWARVKYVDLANGEMLKPFTLSEAVRWVQTPTMPQILAGLNYAAGYVSTD